MNRRERLHRCYFNEPIDRPAVYSRTGFPAEDPTYDRLRAYLEERTELKRGWGAGRLQAEYDCEARTEEHTEDFERCIETLHTPAGDLNRSVLVSLKGQPGLEERHFIRSAEDAEKYLSLPDPDIGGDVSPFFELEEEVGDRGITQVSLGFNPGGFVAQLCGSENFAILSMTDREVLHRLCRRRLQIMLETLRYLIDTGVGPYFSMLGEEYIVPPLHGPKDFRDFNVRYDRQIIDLIHESGGRIHIHSHGSIKKVFPDFVEMGTDVLHPFEAPPEGDVLPSEAKEFARGRMCLEGNIQINRMYEAEAEEIRRETQQLIEATFDDGRGLIVCPSASPYIRGAGERCFPQYKAMIDTVLNCSA
jgi:hypothetical protein